MIDILNTAVFNCIVPVMYLFILAFAFFLIRSSPSKILLARSLFGVFGGILFALSFIIVDLAVTGFNQMSVDPSNYLVVIPAGIISFILGFITLLFIDIVIQKGAIAFVVFFIVWVSVVSGYFLLTASDLKGFISLSTVAFLLGNVLYIMMNFSFVQKFLSMTSQKDTADKENSRWEL